jgi:hypothetical protein
VALVVPVIETRVRIGELAVRLIGLDVFSAGLLMPDLLPRQDATIAGDNIFEDGVYASPALLSRRGSKVPVRDAQRWRRRHGDARRRHLVHAHRRRPARGEARRPAAGGRHRPSAGALRSGGWRRRSPHPPRAGHQARQLAGDMEGQAAARPQPARRRRQPGAAVQHLARLSCQPQRAGHGRPAHRRLPGLRHATHRRRAALDPVRAARRTRPLAAHAPRAGAVRRPGDRRARRRDRPRAGLGHGRRLHPARWAAISAAASFPAVRR